MSEGGITPASAAEKLFISSARQAASLAPDDADAMLARGYERAQAWDWKEARSAFGRALELDPTSAWAVFRLSGLEVALGNFDLGVALGKRAAEADPFMTGDTYPMALAYAGRFDEAMAVARAGLAVDSLSIPNCWWCVVVWVSAARGDVAGTRLAQSRVAPLRGPAQAAYYDGIALAKAGRVAEARTVLDSARAAYARKDVNEVRIAGIYTALGQSDSALIWLGKGVDRRALSTGMATSPLLIPLRSDPRYLALLKRIGLR